MPRAGDIQRALNRMAAYVVSAIKKRAFNSGTPARTVDGDTVSPLSPGYAAYKSGTVTYMNKASAKRARARRQASGKGGPGPLVRVEGGEKQRLSPRPPVADQVLSGGTQKALQVIQSTEDSRVIGFNTERARRIAQGLEVRNGVTVGLTDEETEAVLRIAEEEAGLLAEDLEIKVKTATLDIPV